MFKLSRLLVVVLVLGATSSALAQGDRMLIEFVDADRYEKDGLLRYYVDILNRRNVVINDQEKGALKFYINGDKIPAELISSVTLQQFKETGEPIAIGVLFTKYGGFVPKSPGEPCPFCFAKRGLIDLMQELRTNVDSVGIWLYDEEGIDNFRPFTRNMESVVESLKDLPETKLVDIDDGESGEVQAPKFYRHFKEVVSKMGELDDLPRRRILIVISDGVGKYPVNEKNKIEDKLKGIIEDALESGIKIYSFGAMLQEDAFLPFLSRASERTFGVYTKIKEPELLEGAIRDLAPQIFKQYVIDLVAAEHLPGEGEKVKLRIDAETPNGEKVRSVYPRSVPLPKRPTNHWGWIKWVLIGLGGLLGLFLFIWLIKKIVRWRRNRPEVEEEWVDEPEEYTGPDRGKLRIRTGPLAGEVFHLIEDITTIGSIDGNHIVIYDEGVSKRHSGIKIEEMRYELADFGSTNGTWVNGRKINKQFLRDQDEIRIGNTEMTFTLK